LGVTPPTIFVPYAMACSLWNVPCAPVKPWQMTRVFASTNTAADDEWRTCDAAVRTADVRDATPRARRDNILNVSVST
jgi:hypothetical protein